MVVIEVEFCHVAAVAAGGSGWNHYCRVCLSFLSGVGASPKISAVCLLIHAGWNNPGMDGTRQYRQRLGAEKTDLGSGLLTHSLSMLDTKMENSTIVLFNNP